MIAPEDIYRTLESICAFLNRQGGHLLLGVKDDGTIAGIDPEALDSIKKNLITALNNPQKINPPLYALPEQVTVEGKTVLYLAVPESSQVHRCHGKIFDRNEDGDLDVTNQPDAGLCTRPHVSELQFHFLNLNDLFF